MADRKFPADLRRAVAAALAELDGSCAFAETAPDGPLFPALRESYLDDADVVLAVLHDAGCVLLPPHGRRQPGWRGCGCCSPIVTKTVAR